MSCDVHCVPSLYLQLLYFVVLPLDIRTAMLSTVFLCTVGAALLSSCNSACFEDQNKKCPCTSSPDMFPNATFRGNPVLRRRLLCIDHRGTVNSIFASVSPQSLNLNYRHVKGSQYYQGKGSLTSFNGGINDCDVLIKIVDKTPFPLLQIERCPGICRQAPFVIVCPVFLKSVIDLSEGSFAMCSLNITTSAALVHSRMGIEGPDISIADRDLHFGLILRTIAIRRLLECNEKENPVADNSWDFYDIGGGNALTLSNTGKSSQANFASTAMLLSKRPVFGVIIWVASMSRIMLAYNQARVLRLQDEGHRDPMRIMGWTATEDVYPCDAEKNKCHLPIEETCYKEFMPHTYIHLPRSSDGWACGQRRPLRAMGHVLTVYDPDFLLVVDDDTYVNMKLLNYGTVLSSYIMSSMRDNPIVMGEMLGHGISIGGFYYGGSGYLIGRGVLNRLTAYTLDSRKAGDVYRTDEQVLSLGILEEARLTSEKMCPSCVKLRPSNASMLADQGYRNQHLNTADLAVRVVDLCINMMSQAGTCYHSDHSISRCLSHGVYADTVAIKCNGTDVELASGDTFVLGMCFWKYVCDRSHTITCHRHSADPVEPSYKPFSTVE